VNNKLASDPRPADRSRPARLLELYVEDYKNLNGLRMSWSERVVLYGPNGAGKTNLIETLALIAGSRATLWQLTRRAEIPKQGALSVVLETDRAELPISPRVAAVLATDDGSQDDYQRNLIFWQMLGAERGRSWEEAWWSGIASHRLAQFMSEQAERPLIRYRLEKIHGLEEAALADRGGELAKEYHVDPDKALLRRHYSRCLTLAQPPPAWLIESAPDLPEPFAPLRRWLAEPESSRSPHPELLELPPSEVNRPGLVGGSRPWKRGWSHAYTGSVGEADDAALQR
jgi:energy-coupling factor transporter ATP-binding protein EcfA2